MEFYDNRQRSDFSGNDMIWSGEVHFPWKACAKDTQAHCLCNPKKDSRRYTTSPKGLLNFLHVSGIKTERPYDIPLFNLFDVFIEIGGPFFIENIRM